MLFLLVPTLARAELLRVGHVQVELVAEEQSVRPGDSVNVAFRILHDPNWHSYWESSTPGYPPKVLWKLPPGWKAGALQHPLPEIHASGGIVDYVHTGDALFVTAITVPKDAKPGAVAHLEADVSWLACDEECVPGDAKLKLDLPVAAESPRPTEWSGKIAAVGAAVVSPGPQSDWLAQACYSKRSRTVGLTVTPRASGNVHVPGALYFFSSDGSVEATEIQSLRPDGRGMRLTLPLSQFVAGRPDRLDGILVATNGWTDRGAKALRIQAAIPVCPELSAAASQRIFETSLHSALFYGLLGGLILNLMPCVFPVLGLKVLAFVRMAGTDRRAAWTHALVFASGVLVSFLALAAMLLAFRYMGSLVGWGFQMQHPGVLFLGALIFLLFALNMNGVFELGASACGLGPALCAKCGWAEVFLTGVLAVVVSTPCSAPFLGTAIGYALDQPATRLIAVFLAVGVGFSLPYIVLAAFPALLRWLPKPGRWMIVLKHCLSVLLYGTAVYFLWALLPSLHGPIGFLRVIAALILTVAAAFVYGHWVRPETSRMAKLVALGLTWKMLVVAVVIGWPHTRGHYFDASGLSDKPAPAFADDAASSPRWTRWRPGLAEELAREGRYVYVDFTARWCATCQVNEAVVFASPEVREFFREHDVVALKADWTRRDEEITAELAKRGRYAVPLNLIYPPYAGVPYELPTLLTPDAVLDAFTGRDK